MPAWAGVAIGGAQLIGGMMSSSDAADSQQSAMDSQSRALEDQVQLGRDQLNFTKQQYADWQKNFQPSITALGNLANQQIRPDFSSVTGDVNAAFDTADANNVRNMQRYGINPTDGQFNASRTQSGIARALAEVQGDQGLRHAAQQDQWNRLAGFVGAGMGQQGNLLGSMNSASNGLMGAFGNMAGMYGQRAALYGQSAMAGAGLAGSGLSALGNVNWGSLFGGGSSGGGGGIWSGVVAGGGG